MITARSLLRRAWLTTLFLGLGVPAARVAAVDVVVSTTAGARIPVLHEVTGALEGFLNPCDPRISEARGLRLDPDGRIYAGTPGGLYRMDASTGAFVDILVSGLPGFVLFNERAPDGSLWLALGDTNKLAHVDGAGAVIGLVDTPYPVGLAIGADGNLYVGSFTPGQISRFDPTTGALIGTFGPPAPGGIMGLTRGPDGDFYAAVNTTPNDVARFDGTTGAYKGLFIRPGDRHPSGARGPRWGPDGNLWVTSISTGEVLRYDPTGAYLGVFASGLASPGSPLFVPGVSASLTTLPVDTTSGSVTGSLECGVGKYLGVPYAEAPTGALRWRRPVRKAASPTPILATGFGPACPQISNASAIGDEDCLKLSVWAPPKDPNAPPLPVLFYIHGGGLAFGSMSWPVTEGSGFALAQNAIVVEPQYRLGALGFFGRPGLAAEDSNGSTGNYGFLDQLEALRWVRDNIAGFGGDPNQVTIAGQSAGGWSVCALMASPLSDGLFRAGIVQSGQCYNARGLTDLPSGSAVLSDPFFGSTIYKRSADVAGSAGCGADDLACLRGMSAASLVQALNNQPHTISGDPPVNPAIDGYFLAEQPLGLLRQGAADHRPLMIGTVANEATHFTDGLENLVTSPAVYDLFLRSALGNARTDALETVYPATNVPSVYPTLAEEMRVLLDDAGIVCSTVDAADAITQGGSPAFVYQLTFSPTYLPSSTKSAWRTFHTLDLYYVFGTYSRLVGDYGIATDADDAALSVAMQSAWGSFVRTGVPTTIPAWPVYAPSAPGDLAGVSVLNFDVPNSTIAGNLFRGGRCAALLPVANQLDPDRDVATSEEDNCPVTTNTSQADAELDAVGDACDNCGNVSNARVVPDFLTTNPWATLTGGQRDDDHDGYGNKCDADFTPAGSIVGPADLTQFRASNGKSRTGDTCGTAGNRPCAIFDLDESSALIGSPDLNRFRNLNGKVPGPKCPTCPLACTAGTAGSCP